MSPTRVPHPSIRSAALAVTLAGALLAGAATAAARAQAPAYAPHEVIVGYRTPPAPAALARADAIATGTRHPAPSAGAAAVRSQVVRLPSAESVATALRRLRARAGVAYALPDYVVHAAGAISTTTGFYPDDPGRARRAQGWERMQWNFLAGTGIDAPLAWANLIADHRPGGRGVTIAVLDTGVAYRNWEGFKESPDLRGARFVDPYDFVAHNRYPLDRDGHGTFVTSVLAESTNNGIGLTGLAYGASIMPIRVLGEAGTGYESTVAAGIRYAVAHHAQIINLSLEFLPNQVSSARQIPQVIAAIQDAQRHGVIVVAAAGNDQTRQLAYPARVSGVVSVGATTQDGCLASYSNVGGGLDLVAPGGGDDAILPDDPACHPARDLPPVYQLTLSNPPHWAQFGYPRSYIGTSMSVPEVSGAAAMVIASGVLGPHPTPSQVLARLEQTATPLPAPGRVPNATYGWGLLNVGAATSPLTASAAR